MLVYDKKVEYSKIKASSVNENIQRSLLDRAEIGIYNNYESAPIRVNIKILYIYCLKEDDFDHHNTQKKTRDKVVPRS